jgi:hypothetical protein
MSRLFGVLLASVCAMAALGMSRPTSAQDVITTCYAPTVSAPVVASYPVETTAYYAPAPVTTYYAPAPVTTYYAPTTTYYAPNPVTNYYAPTVTSYYAPVATPYTSYYAPVATPYTSYYAPVATPYYSAGYAPVATPYVAGYAPAYYYGRPRVYVPGEPVRNFFRAL